MNRRVVTALLADWSRLAFSLDTRSLAAFRIAMGLILVADSLLRFRTLEVMFAADGAFPPDMLRAYQGTPATWSLALLCDATWWAAVVVAAEGVTGAWLASGMHARAATVAAWVAAVSVVHRTEPAANAGDSLLVCLLFWSMFLPLGAHWTVAGSRRRTSGAVLSIASAALVLQIAAVYLGAGIAKLNVAWFSGEAVSYALSAHDHGNGLGMALSRHAWLTRPATWAVLVLEIAGPLAVVLSPQRIVRGCVVAMFILFHCCIWATMWVGIFAAVGITAWLPLLPASFWNAVGGRRAHAECRAGGLSASLTCGAAAVLAAASFLEESGGLGERGLPPGIRAAIMAAALEQRWTMFGEMPLQEQWVYGEAVLADGRVVDLLRAGRPLERERPRGGFASLGSHRWHKLYWNLAGKECRMFASPTAAALARQWNARHGANEQVRSLELRFVIRREAAQRRSRQDVLLAAWPPRGAAGHGNLDRLLQSLAPDESVAATDR